MTWIRSRDVISGLIFVAAGALGLALGVDLQVGTGARMGPGYFPMLLCWALIGVGALLIGRTVLVASETMEAWSWRPLVFVTVSIVLFGLLVERAGLAVSMVLLVCIGAQAGRESRWKEVAALAVGLAVFSIVAFIWGLGLPLKALPS